ncbi:MAG: nuclear transport factor 2 family protein [Candidatus Dormibacteraeota bacterium]|nr:nuclear transport factor 2 family protein [Candidatus Dormibacteraeota bacterium]
MGAISDRVRRLNAAVNAHDLNPIGDYYADDAEFIWPGLPAVHGRQAVVAFYAELLGAFPDVKVTIKRIVEQGDTVAVDTSRRVPMVARFLSPAVSGCRLRTGSLQSRP